MIILNQNNGKKIYGNKYLYNLFCDKNITIKNLILKVNIKKNIIFGFIGKDKKYILNPIYDEDETNININIELLKGDNFIYLYNVNNIFEIIINNKFISLESINTFELNEGYIINKNYNFDLLLNPNKYYFVAHINDPAQNNFYEINLNNNKLNIYHKYDNFLNFKGYIEILNKKIYNLSFNMKYLINIINIIIIYKNDNIINFTNNNDNIYKMNPIIAYNYLTINAYYIELKLDNFNNFTRVSFDKNNKIILKMENNILYINNKKLFRYNSEYLKLILNSNNVNETNIYIFNDTPNRREWIKILTINLKLDFYQKLYETEFYDSHINKKIITFRKAYIYKCNKEHYYLNDINIKYSNEKPIIFLNNYTLILGGDLNNNQIYKSENFKLQNINKNIPLLNNTIDESGNIILNECFNNSIVIKNSNINNNSNYIIMNQNNTTTISKILNKTFMFENLGRKGVIKSFILITIILMLYIKIFNR